VARLAVDDALAFGRGFRVTGRKWHITPVDPFDLGLRWVPGMVRIGKAHPAEPVVLRIQRVEPTDRPIGHPVGVVKAAVDRIDRDLRRSGVPTPGGVHL
jgi:hypothetical protein